MHRLMILLVVAATPAFGLPFVRTDKASYLPGEAIAVTYNILHAETNDWVCISPTSAGENITCADAQYAVNARISTFVGLLPGTYVARTFVFDDIEIVAESAPFVVMSGDVSLTTDKTLYGLDEPVIVSTTGLIGARNDWIGIVPVGAGDTDYVLWSFDSSPMAFSGLPEGQYIARGFFRGTADVAGVSLPFVVARNAATVATNKSSYVRGESIIVTTTGLRAQRQDWVGIVPVGAEDTHYVAYAYVDADGVMTLPPVELGTYVTRAFRDNGATVVAVSAPFAVVRDVTLSVAQTTHSVGEPVIVHVAGMSGLDWVGVTPVGQPELAYVAYAYAASADLDGSIAFFGLPVGQYVARGFADNGAEVIATSTTFVVAMSYGAATVDAVVGAAIDFSWSGAPAIEHNWAALVLEGGDVSAYVDWQYVSAVASGASSFALPSTPGRYVVRLYADNSAIVLGESAAFDVPVAP
jgi:hypothetical protein